MTARDRYPARVDGTTWTVDEWPEMCDEIDRLRAEIDRLRKIIAAMRAVLEDDS